MLDRAAFLAELAQILGVDAGAVTPEAELHSFEDWDSLAHLSTILLIDEKCGVDIAPDALVGARTVGDILALVGDR